MSFTLFLAGGLFQWVNCSCMTQKDFEAKGGVLQKEGREQWLEGLGHFDSWESLLAHSVVAVCRG